MKSNQFPPVSTNSRRKAATILPILLAALLACNLPGATQPVTSEMQTRAAQTVQAVLTPLGSPTAISTDAPTVTQSSAPILSVADNTNCRTGPGTGFAKVTTLPAGTSVQIVGRNAGGTHWMVDPPDVAENCWVASELGTVSGDVSALPEVTPAAESAGAPAKPSIQKWDFFCNGTGQTDVSLVWSDKATNEAGYRVYRNGTAVAELAANTTQYFETITLLSGQSAGYNVEAFNSSGTASTAVITMTCP